jgi:hypothetical protein
VGQRHPHICRCFSPDLTHAAPDDQKVLRVRVALIGRADIGGLPTSQPTHPDANLRMLADVFSGGQSYGSFVRTKIKFLERSQVMRQISTWSNPDDVNGDWDIQSGTGQFAGMTGSGTGSTHSAGSHLRGMHSGGLQSDS